MDEDEFCSSTYGLLQSRGPCALFTRITHRQLERLPRAFGENTQVLEVGANLGEHCSFVTHPFSSYLVTDYRPVNPELPDTRFHFEQADVHRLPYPDERFDRVVITCLLHHLDQPEDALREVRRVTKCRGVVSILIPCDPGVAYRLAKRLGPYRVLRKEWRIAPELFHYRQHRNHFPQLKTLVEHVFESDEVLRRPWPLPLGTWNANLFFTYQIVRS